MFERFVRLARAREAHAEGRWEQVLSLTSDPLIADARKAVLLRQAAIDGILTRAAAHLQAGRSSDALADCDAVLRQDPEHGDAIALRRKSGDAKDQSRQQHGEAGSLEVRLRRAVHEGRLAEADILLGERDALAGQAFPPEDPLRKLVVGRRDGAAARIQDAVAAGDDLDRVASHLAAAVGLDRDCLNQGAEGRRLAVQLQSALASRLDDVRLAGGRVTADGAAAAWGQWRSWRSVLPQLEAAPEAAAAVDRVAQVILSHARERLASGDAGEALAAGRAVLAWDSVLAAHTRARPMVAAAELILAADDEERRGALAEASQSVERAAALVDGGKAMVQRAAALAVHHRQVEAQLAEARQAAAAGDSSAAMDVLGMILQRHPTHEAARREWTALEDGLGDRKRLLDEARELGRGGRLREASTKAIALAVPGPAGADARRLVSDFQARMGLVQRGIDEVLALLHKRESATREGLEHGVSKLEQLALVQSDHPDLDGLRVALQAEVEGLDLLARAAAQRGASSVRALEQVVQLRPKLLRLDRLDARIQAHVDELLLEAERDVAAGRLGRVDELLGLIDQLDGPQFAAQTTRLRDDVVARKAAAHGNAALARERLDAKDLGGAEAALEGAIDAWGECPQVRRVEGELAEIRAQEAVLGEVQSLADGDDVASAARRMHDLPPTPAVLRTRIFDMKRDLAKAQGLADGFVLRVDEGGEFAVVRSDSVSFGNLRQAASDLPILANLAARHAVLDRRMSFHGGMEDTLRAEGGPVFVRGRDVESVTLESGLEVGLGKSLRLRYAMPSTRSLTARLQILGGFQVMGTDRILLMKDRGRDGRILIGGTPDAHVRVSVEGEVELFANSRGQMVVRASKGGDIDGQPFQGEHPVAAGEVVRSGGVVFVLQPREPR